MSIDTEKDYADRKRSGIATDEVSSDGLQEADGPYSVHRSAGTDAWIWSVAGPLIEDAEAQGYTNSLNARQSAHFYNQVFAAGAQAERERVNGLAAEMAGLDQFEIFVSCAPSTGRDSAEWLVEAPEHKDNRRGETGNTFIEALESAANPDNQGATA